MKTTLFCLAIMLTLGTSCMTSSRRAMPHLSPEKQAANERAEKSAQNMRFSETLNDPDIQLEYTFTEPKQSQHHPVKVLRYKRLKKDAPVKVLLAVVHNAGSKPRVEVCLLPIDVSPQEGPLDAGFGFEMLKLKLSGFGRKHGQGTVAIAVYEAVQDESGHGYQVGRQVSNSVNVPFVF